MKTTFERSMPMVTRTIEAGEDEIEVNIYFDFQPYEAQTWDYPGCDASADIYEVIVCETGAEVCLLKDEEERIRVELLEAYEEERTMGDPRW
jgi:hypothetical protein